MSEQTFPWPNASFEAKLTENARAALDRASEDARKRRHTKLRSVHLLLGIAGQASSVGARALSDTGVTERAAREIASRLFPANKGSPSGTLPVSHGFEDALTAADDESRRARIDLIGTEHLLLGLLTRKDTSAAQLLRELQVTPAQIRHVVQPHLVPPAPHRDLPTRDAAAEADARLAAIPTHSDRPATADQLGRAHLAEILAERMRRLRREDTECPTSTRSERRAKVRRDRRAAERTGSFLIHVHAPWGAGKSSLLNFLSSELRNVDDERRPWQPRRAKQPHLSQWIVAEFSAWEHQRLAPPWWWLLTAMRRSIRRELWKIDRRRWLAFQVRDVVWHAWNARAMLLALALVAALVVLAWSLDWFGLGDANLTTLKATALSVTAVITLVTLAWGLIRGTSTWLAFGSAAGAVRFMRRAHDPLGAYRRRFRWLVRAAGRPIAVIVDDLDRCNPAYVVELLEGIQTLFADEPVAFVVAADRTWLSQSFATAYSAFDPVVGEAGRPLGYLFLEKTFQVSMEIPPMSRTVRNGFWGTLNTSGAPKEPEAPSAPLRADAFSGATSEPELDKRRAELKAEGVSPDAIQRGLVRRLNAPDVQATLEDVLSEYADLLENNPRAMKRLLNAYGIERDRLLREHATLDPDARRRLVLFSIFRMRWPQFAEYLLRRPEDVALLRAEKSEVDDDHRFRALFTDDDVRQFFNGADGNVALDADVFTLYAGRIAEASEPDTP